MWAGLPGLMLASHTWSRLLALHPHIHCLVSEGALSSQDRWLEPRRRSFLPAKVVMTLYRGKLLHRLRRLLSEGALTLPASLTRARYIATDLLEAVPGTPLYDRGAATRWSSRGVR